MQAGQGEYQRQVFGTHLTAFGGPSARRVSTRDAGHRQGFDEALTSVKTGETLIVRRLDRMSRSLKHLIEINELLKERGAFFESLTEEIDTSTPMGEFVFHILGAVAQLEREIIRERTLAGLAVAAANGNHPGRPRLTCWQGGMERPKPPGSGHTCAMNDRGPETDNQPHGINSRPTGRVSGQTSI